MGNRMNSTTCKKPVAVNPHLWFLSEYTDAQGQNLVPGQTEKESWTDLRHVEGT